MSTGQATLTVRLFWAFCIFTVYCFVRDKNATYLHYFTLFLDICSKLFLKYNIVLVM